MTHPLTIAPLSDRGIRMTRTFDAPRPLVFDAWTKPELLQQWLGVRGGWTMPVCEVDLRVGGKYRYVWEKRGKLMGVSGVYREVVKPDRLVSTEVFDDAWYTGTALITHELEETDGKTTSIITALYESPEARDEVLASPMETGVSEGFAVLDQLLPTLVSVESSNAVRNREAIQ